MLDKVIKTNILIVEDNEFNAMFLIAALDSMGAVCDMAENGQIAVEMAGRKNYDLIFMDCQMPVMDGYIATAKIRKLREPFCKVPIIALTADATKEDKEKCIHCGMDEYLTKPVEIKNLEDIFEKILLSDMKIYKTVSKTIDMQEKSLSYERAVEKLMDDMRFSYQQASELIEEYIKVSSEIIKKMGLAYAKKNYDEIVSLAHQMKGISCNLRLKEFQKIIINVESMSKKQDENLIDEINSLKIMMQEFFI